ncbi:ABC transporter substrate-binding protein [Schlegelella sp. S2-27]|uniref:ABC transporter substrate-binding protein n=1 Tax=Caldimonas mangrovi TaxID=2944811 RepID=A0ABT0YJM1_9BURK|nr:ABC transporter substrate-binding protein [Caldimonas mangrovi]MCM5678926.1 ABC transporter substrate-binding protein [Caldimonas mangrovi]
MDRAAPPTRGSVFAVLRAGALSALLAAGTALAGAPGVYADRVVFGQSAKLSGSGGTQLGRQYRDGALLAFDEANRAGGVHGRRIDLVSLDDRIDRDQAVANTRALIDEHRVFALTHYTFTNPVKAALPLARDAGIPFLAPYTGYPELYTHTPAHVFVMRASFDDELKTIVRHIETVNFRQIGVVFYANALGEEFRDDVVAKLQTIGRPLAVQGSMPLNAKDPLAAAGPAADALRQVCPKVVILGVSGRDAASIVRRMAQTDCPAPRYFARGLVDISLLKTELGPAARGIMVTQVVPNPHRSGHPLVHSYRSLMAQRSAGAVPDFVEFEGYIAGRFIVQALRRCGPQLDRTCFVRALENEQLAGPNPYRLAFGAGRRLGSRYVNIVMLADDGRIAD